MSDLQITIHGPNGSGKTALLKFIGEALFNNRCCGTLERTNNEGGVESAIIHLDDPVALAKSVAKSPLDERRDHTIRLSYTVTPEAAEKLVRAYGQSREAWGAFEERVGEKLDRLERNEPSGLTKDERKELQSLSHGSAKAADNLMFALCGKRPTLEMLRKLDVELRGRA